MSTASRGLVCFCKGVVQGRPRIEGRLVMSLSRELGRWGELDRGSL